MAVDDNGDVLTDQTPDGLAVNDDDQQVSAGVTDDPPEVGFDTQTDEPTPEPEPEPEPESEPEPEPETEEPKQPRVPKEVMHLSQKLAKQARQTEERFAELGSKIDQLVNALSANKRDATQATQQQVDDAQDDLAEELEALENDDLLRPMAGVLKKLSQKLSRPQTPAELKKIQEQVDALIASQREAADRARYEAHWQKFKLPPEQGGFGFDGRPVWESTYQAVREEYAGQDERVIYAVAQDRFNRIVSDRVAKAKAKEKAAAAPPAPTRTTQPATGTQTVSPRASGTRPAARTATRHTTPDHVLFG